MTIFFTPIHVSDWSKYMVIIAKNVAQPMRTLITKYQNFTFKMVFHGVTHATRRANPYVYIDGNQYGLEKYTTCNSYCYINRMQVTSVLNSL